LEIIRNPLLLRLFCYKNKVEMRLSHLSYPQPPNFTAGARCPPLGGRCLNGDAHKIPQISHSSDNISCKPRCQRTFFSHEWHEFSRIFISL